MSEGLLRFDLSNIHPNLHLGTSSFSSADWKGVFYPSTTPPSGFLPYYAQQLTTVEIDATWHALPSRRTVESWARRTPDSFTFSLKVPKDITHTNYLENCGDIWRRFLSVLEPLEEKCGPLLFQFPYIAKGRDAHEYRTGEEFIRRLKSFIPHLSDNLDYVVEVRNATWIREELLDIFRTRNIALALTSYFTLPSPGRLYKDLNPITAPFSYIRFLGHHRQMDSLVKKVQEETGKKQQWDEILIDRNRETHEWAEFIQTLLEEQDDVYAYFNNHFAGFAPGSIDLFIRTWENMSK